MSSATSPPKIHRIAVADIAKRTLIPGIILVIVLGALIGFGLSGGSESRYWPGWYLLGVPHGIDEVEIVTELESRGASGLISAANTHVSYMAIPELATVAIRDVDQRLLPGDPRRDPFLHNVDEIFTSGDSSLIYLPADRSLRSYRKLVGDLGIPRLDLLDDRSNEGLLTGLFFLIGCSGVLLFFPGRKRGIALAAVPLAVFSMIAGGASLVLGLLITFLIACRYSGRRWGLPFSLAPTIIVLGLASTSLDFRELVLFFISALGGELLAFVMREPNADPTKKKKNTSGPMFRFRIKKRDHQLFTPVSLTQLTGGNPIGLWPGIGRPALAALFIIPFAFVGFTTKSHPPVPGAEPALGGFDSPGAFSRLEGRHDADSLPDIADLLASSIYQEYFLAGAVFRLPLPGEVLETRRYTENEGTLSVHDDTLAAYDDQWYGRATEAELVRGVGRLYSTLGGPAPITRVNRPLYGNPQKTLSSAAYPLLILALILALVPFALVRRRDRSRKAFVPLSTVRRRAQAA